MLKQGFRIGPTESPIVPIFTGEEQRTIVPREDRAQPACLQLREIEERHQRIALDAGESLVATLHVELVAHAKHGHIRRQLSCQLRESVTVVVKNTVPVVLSSALTVEAEPTAAPDALNDRGAVPAVMATSTPDAVLFATVETDEVNVAVMLSDPAAEGV